jgi:hypothetical protein
MLSVNCRPLPFAKGDNCLPRRSAAKAGGGKLSSNSIYASNRGLGGAKKKLQSRGCDFHSECKRKMMRE